MLRGQECKHERAGVSPSSDNNARRVINTPYGESFQLRASAPHIPALCEINTSVTPSDATFEQSVARCSKDDQRMLLTDRELAEISKRLTEAEAILGVLPQKPSQITAELGLGVIRGALFALDESAADAPRTARTLQKLRLALATLNVPSEVHEHVSEAFRVLGRRHEEALRQVEGSCLVDARYRQQSLRAELQGVRAELAGEDPAAALEPARRAQVIVDALGQRLGPTSPPICDVATPGMRQVVGAKSPQEAVAELVLILGG
jgi:hypothetical protein